MSDLPKTGFLREAQILPQREVTEEEAAKNKAIAASGQRPKGPCRARPASPGLIPVSPTSWWNGVKSGRYPKPVKLGPRTTAWRVEDILNLIAQK